MSGLSDYISYFQQSVILAQFIRCDNSETTISYLTAKRQRRGRRWPTNIVSWTATVEADDASVFSALALLYLGTTRYTHNLSGSRVAFLKGSDEYTPGHQEALKSLVASPVWAISGEDEGSWIPSAVGESPKMDRLLFAKAEICDSGSVFYLGLPSRDTDLRSAIWYSEESIISSAKTTNLADHEIYDDAGIHVVGTILRQAQHPAIRVFSTLAHVSKEDYEDNRDQWMTSLTDMIALQQRQYSLRPSSKAVSQLLEVRDATGASSEAAMKPPIHRGEAAFKGEGLRSITKRKAEPIINTRGSISKTRGLGTLIQAPNIPFRIGHPKPSLLASTKMIKTVISTEVVRNDIPAKVIASDATVNRVAIEDPHVVGDGLSELQKYSCHSPRYVDRGSCMDCAEGVKARAGECRFIHRRRFPIDSSGFISGPGYFSSIASRSAPAPILSQFNKPLTEAHVVQIERAVAPHLLPLIRRELAHSRATKAINRPNDPAAERHICDTCAASIFGGYWFCWRCGYELCLACEVDMEVGSAPDAVRPSCRHKTHLQAASRFSEANLRSHLKVLERYVGERIQCADEDGYMPDPLMALLTTRTHPSQPLPKDPAGLQHRSRRFVLISKGQLDDAMYEYLGARGDPFVVDDVWDLAGQAWNPDVMINLFGDQPCEVEDCETGESKSRTMRQYFEEFQKPDRISPLRLKDWPPSGSLKNECPILHTQFCQSLPAQDYTTPDGVLNLYSRFPSGPSKPDLGPKMYHAFAGVQELGGKGSTRLHMDIADACNIMLYAAPMRFSPSESGGTAPPATSRSTLEPEYGINMAREGLGCAVWDIYGAQHVESLRQYLIEKDPSYLTGDPDPIHSQKFYLDSGMRRELWETRGISSFRIYQYPGQAVMIPAGCPHQVCNLTNCMKIAIDFVSLYTLDRCSKLAKEFREDTLRGHPIEDVLQFDNLLWFAWQSCLEFRRQTYGLRGRGK